MSINLEKITYLKPLQGKVISSYFPKNPVRLYDTGILSLVSMLSSSSAALSFSSNLSMLATCILYMSASLCKAGDVSEEETFPF